jgi:hypothetical protein
MLTKDFRGLKLCEACWNGVHRIRAHNPERWVIHCKGMGCECPCTQLEASQSDFNRRIRAMREQAKRSQITIPNSGTFQV